MTVLAMAMTPTRAADVCNAATRALLEGRFDVRWASAALDAAELAELAAGSDVLVTSWGTPHLDTALFSGPGAPTVVAHAAGSIKWLLDPGVLHSGVTVFSAGTRIAWNVGEYCLAATLASLRRLPEFDAGLRCGAWQPEGLRGRELFGRRVGIIGASSTARAFIELLKPFRCEVAVYDPFMAPERAGQLGVTLGTLEDVVRADIVSIHVPDLPATEGMVTAELLASMPDGALLVNSARGPAVDTAALERELASGRLRAVLDVFPVEPAVLSAELAGAPNTLLTPHIAGDTVEGHAALTGYVLGDVLRWLDHGTLGASHVNPASLAFTA